MRTSSLLEIPSVAFSSLPNEKLGSRVPRIINDLQSLINSPRPYAVRNLLKIRAYQQAAKVIAALGICLFYDSVVADEPSGEAPDAAVQAWFVLTPSFDTLDCTNEGFISAAEVDEHLLTLQHEFSMAMTFHQNTSKPDDQAQKQLLEINDFLVQAMDQDADGLISAFEYRSYVIELIGQADIDGSGDVTPEELSVGGLYEVE